MNMKVCLLLCMFLVSSISTVSQAAVLQGFNGASAAREKEKLIAQPLTTYGAQRDYAILNNNLSPKSLISPNSSSLSTLSESSLKIMLPYDDGIHKAYATEWWYGNFDLKNQFGLQNRMFLAIMRARVNMGGISQEVPVAIIELVDVKTQDTKKYFVQGSLTASSDKLNIIFNATLDGKPAVIKWYAVPSTTSKYNYALAMTWGDTKLNLNMKSNKNPLYEGEDGIVPIGGSTQSYYYSYTDLAVSGSGTMLMGSSLVNLTLSGKGWFDHQWFNSDQTFTSGSRFASLFNIGVKHEWFSVQLSNGTQLVVWQINSNGNIQNYMGAIDKYGVQKDFCSGFTITPQAYWTAPSGKKYASKWNIKKDGLLNLVISTDIPNQIINLPSGINSAFSEFYEGGTNVSGTMNSVWVSGSGYTELTKTY